jgi:flagellar biosynthesis/type III secretory pathway protein FliH
MAPFIPLRSPPRPQAQTPPEPEPIEQLPPAPPPVDVDAIAAAAHAAGVAEARAALEPKIRELERQVAEVGPLLLAVEVARRKALLAAADDMSDIVLAFAQRVVGDALAFHPSALPDLVASVMAGVPEDVVTAIRVREGRADAVRAVLGESLRARVVEDATVDGCRIESDSASIGVSLDIALEGLSKAVADWREAQR